MDLEAYININNFDDLAKANGIECPRLRGYRLMRDEVLANLDICKHNVSIECVEELCMCKPFWNPKSDWLFGNKKTDKLKEYYLINEKDKDGFNFVTGVRWDRIHGRKRKILKTYIHNEYMRRIKSYETFNKYVGRNDILYIHARIGGGNWSYYGEFVKNQPWFIEKVDDPFDSTYCDIYAKIKPVEQEIKDE